MGLHKGQTNNKNGRPPVVSSYAQQLRNALKKVGEIKGKPFVEHFVERAYSEDGVAIALAKKVFPDLSEIKDNDKAVIGKMLVEFALSRQKALDKIKKNES